jgi:hypothetical protein
MITRPARLLPWETVVFPQGLSERVVRNGLHPVPVGAGYRFDCHQRALTIASSVACTVASKCADARVQQH